MFSKLNRRHFIAAGTVAAAMPLFSRSASAQGTWPSRNIRMVCSYPAGGQTDLLARVEGEGIVLEPRGAALRRLRSFFDGVPSGTSLVDEALGVVPPGGRGVDLRAGAEALDDHREPGLAVEMF